MTPYTINDLPALASLSANDYIPVWDSEASGEPTYKIKVSDMIASMVLIASLLKQDDVVNDLTSTVTDKPLSAAQGKALNDNLAKSDVTFTAGSKCSISAQSSFVVNKILYINVMVTVNEAMGNQEVVLTLPSGITFAKRADFALWSGKNIVCLPNGSNITVNIPSGSVDTGRYVISFPAVVA